LVTIFSSPHSFRIICILPKEACFIAEYFRDNIIEEIQGSRPADAYDDDQIFLILRFNNATLHTAMCINVYLNANRMKKVQYPEFSPDLASSDFYFSGSPRSF
jgi:hypothetical protein